jgi:glycerol-3-phosphate dehydrogenase
MNSIQPLNNKFDVVVIGGGIHGATAAWALSRQGISVALIEKGDFGGAASANSEKIIHGGLRYLQQLDIPRMRDSITARRRSLQLLPHLTHPAEFMVPTQGYFLRSKAALLAAMMMNDMISFDRNRGVAATRRISAGRLHGRAFLREVAEALTEESTGAAVWNDGFTENSERFTLSFVLSAEERGAMVRNYAKAGHLEVQNGRITGVDVENTLTGETARISADMVINTAGGWLWELLPAAQRREQPMLWTRAYNVIVKRRLFGRYGVGLEAMTEYEDEDAIIRRGKRNYFFAPWREGTIIGTMYKAYTDEPDECGIKPHEIYAYLDEVNRMYPEAKLTMDDVTFAHAGILPARRMKGQETSSDPAKDTEIIQVEGIENLFAVKGVKYTTAIEVAEKLARKVTDGLGCPYRPHRNETVYGGERLMDEGALGEELRREGVRELPQEVLREYCMLYGTKALDVLSRGGHDSTLLQRICDDQPVLAASVVYAVEQEHAQQLTDVVFRRTGLGSFSYPGSLALHKAALLMQPLLEWSDEETLRQIETVHDVYRKLGVEHVLK